MSLFDSNAEILSRISEGRDLSRARMVDFEHLFPDQVSAEAFAGQAASLGFRTDVSLYDDDLEDESDAKSWNVTASKVMVPTCEQITETEQQLDTLAHRYGGYADGWGFFRD